ncbi:MFS transporter [Paenibacillus mucilaginosus]|uniref:Major facilitator superfamily protein n=3 Tax=Paenibacillus mucilaginosus TaxID=61624 RepID=H6NF80_9BACL|nr:MFS transporter [Paenibacillus mucilaginosus]AEI40900.1 Major facilitator superfamily MFS_1 [Paenibacillus mucilaginosus KNP414]AFC29489.1 major facilitator superfamily protein [Paenibacillus mucilaginosus 3016]AFH61667.1 MFS transporter [Paenibacillus mucilaginosus K02]MCG7211638.1 MFS transporter [Paenibacillus mucilaginosus]WDM30003.1 MFS transporter [Paenibacillus mucilaginosus]
MDKLWTRSFITLTVGMLFLGTGFYLLLPTLPFFIRELGGNDSQIGLAAGMFTIAAVVCRPLVGALLDRYGRRPFILGGMLAFTAAMYLYDWVFGIAALMILRALHGVSWAFTTTSIFTAITDSIPASRRAEGMGWAGASMTVAMAVGPLLGLWVLEQSSYHHLFLFAAGLSAVSLLLASGVRTPFQPSASRGPLVFFDKSLGPIAAGVFFLAVAYGGVTTFLPLFAQSIGVNAGHFFLTYAITLTLTRPLAGSLSDRHGELAVIVPALGVTVAALAVLAGSSGLPGVLTAAVLYGIGTGGAQPALQAATLRIAHPERRGVANASFLTAFDLGIGLGSILLGAVSEYLGYPTLFTISAVSVAVSMMIGAVFVRRMLAQRAARH